jgi:hypothetical protein
MASQWSIQQLCLCSCASTRAGVNDGDSQTDSEATPADGLPPGTKDPQPFDEPSVQADQDQPNPVVSSEDSPGDAGAAPPPSLVFRENLDGLKVHLRPHVHVNGVCERKTRICSAPGRVREMETLEAMILAPGSTPSQLAADYAITWYRSEPSSLSSTLENSPEHDREGLQLGEGAFTPIDSAAGKAEYTLSADDIGCCITAAAKGERGGEVCWCYAANCAGPVEAAPPRAADLRVEGDFRAGHAVRAVYRYSGGKEGATEVWWMRVKDGARENATEPASIQVIGNGPSSQEEGEEDPRVFCLTAKDVGCVFRVKCKPVRSDGYVGEVTTSKSTQVVEPPGPSTALAPISDGPDATAML